jgi:hypothetical protein
MSRLTNDGDKIEYAIFIFCVLFMVFISYCLIAGAFPR